MIRINFIIAALALEHNLVVLTADEHFRLLPVVALQGADEKTGIG